MKTLQQDAKANVNLNTLIVFKRALIQTVTLSVQEL